jgi:ATP-binding cassette, subfamily B, bacterial
VAGPLVGRSDLGPGGALEVVTAVLLGVVIDAALETGPATFFAENWLLIVGFGVLLVLRPLAFGASSPFANAVVSAQRQPTGLSRLHRWTLGQSVTFFDNDFAGRIAQKQMQTARALTDVVNEVINVVAFALASLSGRFFC